MYCNNLFRVDNFTGCVECAPLSEVQRRVFQAWGIPLV